MLRYEYYVYLDKQVNRIVIVEQPIEKESFQKLMDNNGADKDMLLMCCKMYCIGFMMGCGKKSPINDVNEFK